MTTPKDRPSLFFTCLTLFFFILGQLTACSGGGSGGGGASSDSKMTASATEMYPGQFLTVSHDDLSAGRTYDVRLFSGDGYDVTVPAPCLLDGELRFQVPPYVADHDVVAGTVTVSVSGVTGSVPLAVKDTVAVIYETGDQPGGLLRWWLEEALLTYQAQLDGLGSYASDTTDLAAQLQKEIDRLQNAIDEFDARGTMTLYYNDGDTYELTQESLILADELLFMNAAGLTDAYNQDRTTLAKNTLGWLDSFLNDPDANPTQRNILEGLRRFKDETIPNILDRVDCGSDLAVALVTIPATLAGIYIGVKAGAAYAVLYGAGAALAYAGVTGFLSEMMEWGRSRLGSALGDFSAQDYEFGQEWLEHATEAAGSFLLNLGGGIYENGVELINNIHTSWTTIEAEIGLICATQDPQTQPQSVGVPPRGATQDLCDQLEQPPIDAVSLILPASPVVDVPAAFAITVAGGKPLFKIDIDWDDGENTTLFALKNSRSATHTYSRAGTYTVKASVTDIAGHSAAAQGTVDVTGPAGETSVSFPDFWDQYTFTLTFTQGQADGTTTIISDTDVYNTDERVEIHLPGFPSDPYSWPQSTVPVKIDVSGPAFSDWLLYRTSDASVKPVNLLTHATGDVQNLGGQFYVIVVYPESGPYCTVVFKLVGTGS